MSIRQRPTIVRKVALAAFGASCLVALGQPATKAPDKGGLAALGGVSFKLKLDPLTDEEGRAIPVRASDIELAIHSIKNRLSTCGPEGPLVSRSGDDGITVEIPGLEKSAAASVRALLEASGHLELREVSQDNDRPGADGKPMCERVAAGTEIIPGYKAYLMRAKDGRPPVHFLLNRRAALTGKDIEAANASFQRTDAVDIQLNAKGDEKMIALTKPMREGRDRIAVVLDGKVICAPVVNKVPLSSPFRIEGLSEPGEPKLLAAALSSPIENTIKVTEEKIVPPPQAPHPKP